MKYVVISAIHTNRQSGNTSVIRYPFIFPNMLVHSHVAKVASLLVSFMHPTHDIKTTSAGEINSADFKGECYGESTSLNIPSAHGDTNLVQMNDYGSGMVEM